MRATLPDREGSSMKKAVSISIGSSRRNKAVEITLLGETICIERIGADGDMEKAARLYRDLDGRVDAFGVGGADLGVFIDNHWYPFYSIRPMVRYVLRTPLVDGNGLKNTLEKRVPGVLAALPPDALQNRTVFVVSAADRWGMAHGFTQAGYRCIYGDLMCSLGLPVPLYTEKSLKTFAALLMPLAGRLPFHWIYPTGKKQEKHTPKWEGYFRKAGIIAGDCHYINRYMPDRLDGKIIVTNTTTPEDVDRFRNAGIRYLITTTPVLEGRSFGTNMMEAAILAAVGRRQPVDYAHIGGYMEEMDGLLNRLGFSPQLQELY